jgi:hypothetical protein
MRKAMADKPSKKTQDDEPELSTIEVIAEARRPLLIERHRELIDEMEGGLSNMYVTGEADNPRLAAMLMELDDKNERDRIARTLKTLAEDPHYRGATLRDALLEELCLLREQGSFEIATLQKHAIGVYRDVRRAVAERQGEMPGLSDLRALPVVMVTRLLSPMSAEFASPRLGEGLVYTPALADRALKHRKRLHKMDGDSEWHDASNEPRLSREVEQPLNALPEAERKKARDLLIQDRIRSRFYRQVFLVYLAHDELDPKEVEAHKTVFHWLESIADTAHLYPFMQGQTATQKIFRLIQLEQKIIQLYEVYARVASASAHPTYREQFQGKSTRDRLALMMKDHFPALSLSNELTLGALLCPFATFVEWVQERVALQDFVLPPDPKR